MPRAKPEKAEPLKPFFFPTVGNGVTVMAASLEEAEEKALQLAKASK